MNAAAAPISATLSAPDPGGTTSFSDPGGTTSFSALDGWIDVFRTGDHTDMGGSTTRWTAADLAGIVADYGQADPAPVVLGHPETDGPALGWVRGLRVMGDRLQARLDRLDPSFRGAVEAGRYAPRSVALAPTATGWRLRHLGFLGAQNPAVAGLAPTQFSARADGALFYSCPPQAALPPFLSPVETLMNQPVFTPRLVRLSDERGQPRYAVTRYRVLTKRLGRLAEWPVDDMVDVVDDPATRIRFDLSGKPFANSRQSRFRVLHARGDVEIAARSGPGLLDRIMAQIPGLDGPGAEIAEQSAETRGRVIRGFGDTDLNAARYSRWHAKPPSGTGSDTRRGFNDPTLFVAQATREEVAGFAARGHDFRVSWAIPMEIILAPPHMAWNPYRLPELEDRAAVTANGANGNTAATAYAGIHPDRYWYMTPDELFTGRPGWRQRAWVRDPDGTARRVRASGVYIFLPSIENCGPVRLRYPIAPIHHEGSPAYGHALAIREEAGAVQAALTGEIIALKEQARRQDKAIEDLKTYQKAIKDALFREAHANRGED